MIKKLIIISLLTVAAGFSQQENNLLLRYTLGQSYENSGDLQNAIKIYEELYQSDPNNPQYFTSLNKAYVAAGTMQELEEKDVLEKKKGLIPWISNKVTLSKNLSQNSFTEVNIMNTKTIPVHSKKAELLTYHPKGSYDFVQDSNKMIAYLEIKNPEEFWKVSKYAVLEIKGTAQR